VARSYAAACLAAVAIAATCGALTSCGGCGGNGGSAGASSGPPPTGTLHGNLQVISTIAIPAAGQATIAAHKSDLDALGYAVADDGSTLSGPQAGAFGWIVKLGSKTTFAGPSGDFVVDSESGDPAQADVYWPGWPDQPMFTVALQALVPDGQAPVPIVFEWAAQDMCGMEVDDAGAPAGPGCHATAPASPSPAPRHRPKDPPKTYQGALGTYPKGGQSECQQNDGPTATALWGIFDNEKTNFIGSTCWDYVMSGCCYGERATPSLRLQNALVKWVLTSDLMKTWDALNKWRHCVDVHHGRYCQELAIGNLALGMPDGTIQHAGPLLASTLAFPYTITLGTPVTINVHDDGCYGQTIVVPQADAGGTLSGGGYTDTFVPAPAILHYTPVPGGSPDWAAPYVTDQAVTYTPPKCIASTSAYDHFFFESDGSGIGVDLRVSTDHLFQFPGGSIFSAAEAAQGGFTIQPPSAACPSGCWVQGSHPCTGAPDPGGACGQGVVTPLDPRDAAMCAGGCQLGDASVPADIGTPCSVASDCCSYMDGGTTTCDWMPDDAGSGHASCCLLGGAACSSTSQCCESMNRGIYSPKPVACTFGTCCNPPGQAVGVCSGLNSRGAGFDSTDWQLAKNDCCPPALCYDAPTGGGQCLLPTGAACTSADQCGAVPLPPTANDPSCALIAGQVSKADCQLGVCCGPLSSFPDLNGIVGSPSRCMQDSDCCPPQVCQGTVPGSCPFPGSCCLPFGANCNNGADCCIGSCTGAKCCAATGTGCPAGNPTYCCTGTCLSTGYCP
jgi:hypothetical protein